MSDKNKDDEKVITKDVSHLFSSVRKRLWSQVCSSSDPPLENIELWK